jgi:hypothetical protein
MFRNQDSPKAPQKVKFAVGLAASSHDAVEHGYLSQALTILATESQDAYNELRDYVLECYAPAILLEQHLVEVLLEEDAPDDSPVNLVAPPSKASNALLRKRNPSLSFTANAPVPLTRSRDYLGIRFRVS